MPQFFSTLQFSFNKATTLINSATDFTEYIDQTAQLLSHYIRLWVLFNSDIGTLASQIVRTFPQQLEVIIAQPTEDLSDICCLTTPHELVVCNTVASFSSLLNSHVPLRIIPNARHSR